VAVIPKTLLIVCGHEGAGKTRVTLKLESAIDVGVIDKDPINNKFTTARSDNPHPVHQKMRPLVYRMMYRFAEEHLKEGEALS